MAPQDVVFWYVPKKKVVQLKTDARADVVIVGGGMAGMSAAQSFRSKGCSVILIEKNLCGSGASGKSSGFITPDSEFSLHQFVKRYGSSQARRLWEYSLSGVALIQKNIEDYALSCEYQKQGTLVVALTEKDFASEIQAEHHTRLELGYESNLYDRRELPTLLGSDGYHGGVRYSGTFGINGFQYLQGMIDILRQQGVAIYEETPAISIEENGVKTPFGTILADQIVLCTDRFTPQLGKLPYDLYHAQTSLLLSAPLTDAQVSALFPQGPLMTWDTDLIYQYWRIVGDNRLLLGGSTILQTYASKAIHDNSTLYKKLTSYFTKKFPQVTPQFEYMWPGLIGVSKDILPLVGRDANQRNLYYVAAAAGLPWAAALGSYAADALIENRSDLDEYFSPYRPFTFGPTVQKLFGTRLTFALSHVTSLQSF